MAPAAAGILIVIGLRMIDRRTLDLLKYHTTRLDFVAMAAVTGTALGKGLIPAAGVGLALSILLFVQRPKPQLGGTA